MNQQDAVQFVADHPEIKRGIRLHLRSLPPLVVAKERLRKKSITSDLTILNSVINDVLEDLIIWTIITIDNIYPIFETPPEDNTPEENNGNRTA